jgi:hypothetical protein
VQDDNSDAENEKDDEKKSLLHSLLWCAAIHGLLAARSISTPENSDETVLLSQATVNGFVYQGTSFGDPTARKLHPRPCGKQAESCGVGFQDAHSSERDE